MTTETERIWGAGIAALLQALKNAGVKVDVCSKYGIFLKYEEYYIRCKKNDDNPNTGVFYVHIGTVLKPAKLHFVSNKEALLYLQSIEVSDAWTKAAKATERAFN
jgi:hypothetical protein